MFAAFRSQKEMFCCFLFVPELGVSFSFQAFYQQNHSINVNEVLNYYQDTKNW